MLVVSVLAGGSSGLALGAEPARPSKPPTVDPSEPELPERETERYRTVITTDPGRVSPFSTTRSVDVMGRAELDRIQPRALPDALREIPGVAILETNRGSGQPVVRGLSGGYSLNLLDHVRYSKSTYRPGGNQYLALLDPFALEAVEVLRGPGSVRYGNGAIGGIVHALSANPPDGRTHPGLGGVLSLAGASADTSWGGNGQLHYAGEDGGLLAGGGFRRFGTLRAGGGFEERLSDYDAGTWRAKGLWRPDDRSVVSALYLGSTLGHAMRTDALGRGSVTRYDDTEHFATLSFERFGDEGAGAFRWLRVSGSFHQIAEGKNVYRCKTVLGADGKTQVAAHLDGCSTLDPAQLASRQDFRDTVRTPGVLVRSRFGLLEEDRLVLEAGAEAYADLIGSSGVAYGSQDGFATASPVVAYPEGHFPDGARYVDTGAFSHGRLRVTSLGDALGSLIVNAGGRISHIRASAPATTGFGAVDYRHTGGVGAAGLQLLGGHHNAYASLVQGFRAPILQEGAVAGSDGSKFRVPNPNLSPERSDTLEAGLRWMMPHLAAGAAVFRTWMKDPINEVDGQHNGQSAVEGLPVITLVNAGRADYRGAEASLRLDAWRFVLEGHMTWVEGDVAAAGGKTTPARRTPPLFGRAGLRYQDASTGTVAEVYSLFATAQDRLHPSDAKDLRICEGARYSGLIDPKCQGTPGWATLNVRTNWSYKERFGVQVLLGNLLDAQYRVHGSGLNAPGREARVSMTGRF